MKCICEKFSEMDFTNKLKMEELARKDLELHEEWDYLFDGSQKNVEKRIKEISKDRAFLLATYAFENKYYNTY